MNTIKVIIILSTIILTSSCKNNNKKKSNNYISKELESSKNSSKNIAKLILRENIFGDLKLEKGMPLDELKLKELFPDFTVSKNIGEQDGPNYYYYKIGTKAILTTTDTENETFSQLLINEESDISDEYGIKLGMAYDNIKENRPNMEVSIDHYRIFLFKKNSKIQYKISLENYNGPDKEEYTLDDIANYKSKVVSIIWSSKSLESKNVSSNYDYVYKSENGKNIGVTYFSDNNKMYVKLKLSNQNELTLEQTTAWAKGAEYGKKDVLWNAQGSKGTLVRNGIKTGYRENK